MHIPDGFLSREVALGTYAASGLGVGMALRKLQHALDERMVPVIGMMAAFIFAAQMLNFPVAAGTSGHFMGCALAVFVLGPAGGLLVMTLVLVLQCLLAGDGGLTALGANVFNMGVVGCLVSSIFAIGARWTARGRRAPFLAASAVAAFLSIVLASACCSVELALSGTAQLWVTLAAMVGVHALIGVAEAAITVAALSALLSARPDLVATWPQPDADLLQPTLTQKGGGT